MIAFARASDALACAMELQRAPLAPIRLRIGVHTGEVPLRDEGNYAGPTIDGRGATALSARRAGGVAVLPDLRNEFPPPRTTDASARR